MTGQKVARHRNGQSTARYSDTISARVKVNNHRKPVDTKKYQNLCIWIHERINETGDSKTLKIKVGKALLQHSLDLADGSMVLVDRNLPGAALALARPIFESYVRGIWALYCATDDDLKKFGKKGQPNPWHLSKLVKLVQQCKPDQSAWISSFNQQSRELNDLVHGGNLHLRARIGDGVIQPDYPAGRIRWLIAEGIEVQIRVACEFFDLMCDVQAMEDLAAYLKRNFDRPHV